jgi:hypothetical protein
MLPPDPSARRFIFRIDRDTPERELLPTPPKVKQGVGRVTGDDLSKVPEAEFQARPEKLDPKRNPAEPIAHQLAKIKHMNVKKTDAFMAALRDSRSDLAGLPFAMGDACRTTSEQMRQFTIAVNTVRQALNSREPVRTGDVPMRTAATPPLFWESFPVLCSQQDALGRPDKEHKERVMIARIAALMQILATASPENRLGLIKYLTGVAHADATKALARLAIFSAEDDVRQAAIESLKVRREKDYTDMLVKGLRYPWPAVAKNSADAIAKMGRNDLIPELIGILESPDPRMPVTKADGRHKSGVVRELVKVNHHRNCMMCHAPSTDSMPESAMTAEVPVPGQPLPTPLQGYRKSSPDLMIRVDVTYLRQDFSAMLPVAEPSPWPEMQRFDFLVRERSVNEDEAKMYREKLTPKEAGVFSPYHKAALAALREITGKDAAPTAEAWKKLLNPPATR